MLKGGMYYYRPHNRRCAMKLEEWLTKNNKPSAKLADDMGVTRAAVSRWISGVAVPSLRNAVLIEKLRQGYLYFY